MGHTTEGSSYMLEGGFCLFYPYWVMQSTSKGIEVICLAQFRKRKNRHNDRRRGHKTCALHFYIRIDFAALDL